MSACRAITSGGIQYQVMAGNAMLSDLYTGAEFAVQVCDHVLAIAGC